MIAESPTEERFWKQKGCRRIKNSHRAAKKVVDSSKNHTCPHIEPQINQGRNNRHHKRRRERESSHSATVTASSRAAAKVRWSFKNAKRPKTDRSTSDPPRATKCRKGNKHQSSRRGSTASSRRVNNKKIFLLFLYTYSLGTLKLGNNRRSSWNSRRRSGLTWWSTQIISPCRRDQSSAHPAAAYIRMSRRDSQQKTSSQ